MDEILDLIKTTEDRDRFITDIGGFEKVHYLSDEKAKDEIHKISPENISALNSLFKSKNTKRDLNKLKDKLIQLPVIRIVISFDPPESVIGVMSDWVRENLDKHALLQINVKRKIGAGAEISYEGKYLSHTIESRLEEYFQENKRRMIEKIRGDAT